MLENLLIAVESDGQGVDLNRVAGFMQKVTNPTNFIHEMKLNLGFRSEMGVST